MKLRTFTLGLLIVIATACVSSAGFLPPPQWTVQEYCSASSAYAAAASIASGTLANTIHVIPTNDATPRWLLFHKAYGSSFLPDGLTFTVFSDLTTDGTTFYTNSVQSNRGAFKSHVTGDEIVWVITTPLPCP